MTKTLPSTLTSKSLRVWNRNLGLLYGLQALAILVLGKAFTVPLSIGYQTRDSLASSSLALVRVPADRVLADFNVVYLVTAMLLLPGIILLLQASTGRQSYEQGLRRGINHWRWLSATASLVPAALAVAVLTGIFDIVELAVLAALAIAINAGWWFSEASKNPRARMVGFWLACGAAIVVLLAIGATLLSSSVFGMSGTAGYLWGTFLTLLVLCATAAVVVYRQAHARGKQGGHLAAERAFAVLNFVLLSVLAWQIFAGTL